MGHGAHSRVPDLAEFDRDYVALCMTCIGGYRKSSRQKVAIFNLLYITVIVEQTLQVLTPSKFEFLFPFLFFLEDLGR